MRVSKDQIQIMTCNFVFMCSGYYSYKEGYTPDFAGIDFLNRYVSGFPSASILYIDTSVGSIELDVLKSIGARVKNGDDSPFVSATKFSCTTGAYLQSGAALPPLGLMKMKDDTMFKTTTENIADKVVLIYTDGVTEGYLKDGSELRVDGLENEIIKTNSLEPIKIIDRVCEILTESNEKLRDDVTCLGISI